KPAERVPVPSALPPLRRGALRRRGAPALSLRRWARGRVPLPARALADGGQRDAAGIEDACARTGASDLAARMLLAAIRRFLLLVLLASGFTAVAALLIGLLLGGSLDH